MSADPRGARRQIMLTSEELAALDQWRFSRHMPSRAAAVRELLRRGLAPEGLSKVTLLSCSFLWREGNSTAR